MSALSYPTGGPSSLAWPRALLRRHTDLWLALSLGGMVAYLILNLPMQAALATSVVGAFVLIALVDTRVALLALLAVRATMDATATVPLLSAGGAASVNANAMMSLLVIGLGMAHIAIHRVDVRRIPLVAPFGIFVIVAFVGLGFAQDLAFSGQDWLRVLGSLVVYILAVDALHTHAQRRWLLNVIVASALIPVGVGLYQMVTESGIEIDGVHRVLGTFVYPSQYGFYLVQLLPLVLVLTVHTENRLGKLALLALLVGMVICVYATQTRGAWIGVLVMLAVVFWFRARPALLLIPLIVAAAYLGSGDIRERTSEAVTGTCVSAEYCESSALWRVKQWERAMQLPSPIQLATVGAGVGSITVAFEEPTHNEYVRLLTETGLLGAAAMAVLYVSLFRIAKQGYDRADTPFKRDLMLAFLATFIARLVMSGADNLLAITVLEWYFWALAAVIVVESGAFDRFARARENEQRNQRLRGGGAVSPETAA